MYCNIVNNILKYITLGNKRFIVSMTLLISILPFSHICSDAEHSYMMSIHRWCGSGKRVLARYMEHVCELLTHIRRRAKVCENCDAHSPPYIYTRHFVARTHSLPVTKTVEITTQSHATTNTLRVEHYKMCVCRYVCVFEAFPLAKIRCLAWYGNVCVGCVCI